VTVNDLVFGNAFAGYLWNGPSSCRAETGASCRRHLSQQCQREFRRAKAFDIRINSLAGDHPGGTVHFWDLKTGKTVRTIDTGVDGGRVGCTSVCTSEDCNVLAAYRTGAVKITERGYIYRGVSDVRIWDVDKNRLVRTFAPLEGHGVDSLALAPDGLTCVTLESPRKSTGASKAVLGNIQTGTRLTLRCNPRHQESAFGAMFTADGKIVFVPTDDNVDNGQVAALCGFDTNTGALKLKLDFGATILGPFVDAPHFGQILISGHTRGPSSSVQLWDILSGKKMSSYDLGKGVFWHLAVSPDGKTCAALKGPGLTSVDSLMLFDISKGRLTELASFPMKGDLCALAFNPSSTLLAMTSQVGV
jgi:WD40 repeat protein